MNDFFEEKKCNICGSNSVSPIFNFEKNYFNKSEFETSSWDGRQDVELRIVRCDVCGLIYTHPSFKEIYLNLLYPEDLVPNKVSLKSIPLEKYLNLLNIIKRHCTNGSLCDIGTRYGFFPQLAKKHGYDAFGIEFNSASVKNGVKNGVEIYEGTIKNLKEILAKRNTKRINNFILDDVLEHLVNPLNDIIELSKYQNTGDLIFLKQMNFNSLGRKLYGKRWYYLSHAHMYYFDDKSIKKLLSIAGYKVIAIYKPNFFYNVFITSYLFFKRKLIKQKVNLIGNKNLYLTIRKKSFNDIFTVVGQKV